MSRLVLAFVAVVALFVGMASANASAPAPKEPQVCGNPAGDGAYYFVRVWNISCDRAESVAGNAFDHFCDENDCFSDPGGGYVKGRVSFRGWDCKIKLGYEFSRAVCEKPGARFVSESGA